MHCSEEKKEEQQRHVGAGGKWIKLAKQAENPVERLEHVTVLLVSFHPTFNHLNTTEKNRNGMAHYKQEKWRFLMSMSINS